MAFSDAQKVDIRMWMGWPQLYLQTYSELEYAMQAVEVNSDMQAKVEAILSSLDNIDAELLNALKYIKADRVDSIENQNRMAHINILRSEGRRHVGRLSALLNTPIRQDVFSGSARSSNSNYLTIA